MSTYSLTLRTQINRRLTVNEMDANFLYLQDLANSIATGVTGPTGPTGSGGIGSSFDQDLNTFNSVSFNSMTTQHINTDSGTVSVNGNINLFGYEIGTIETFTVNNTYTWLQGVTVDNDSNKYVIGGDDNGNNFVAKLIDGEFIWIKQIVDNIGASPSIVPNLSNIEFFDNYIYVSGEWSTSFAVFKFDLDGTIIDSWAFESPNGFDLTEMIVNLDGPIVVGRKNDEYFYTATFSNSEVSGTVSNLVINKSYFDDFPTYPKVWVNWEINGTDLTDWIYVNSNNTNKINNIEVVTLTGNGTDLKVSVTYDINTQTYEYVDVYTNGTGYQTGDLLLVKGGLLGNGVDGKTYSTVLFNNSGQSLYFEVSSYPDFDQAVQNGWRVSGTGITGYGTVSNLQNTGALWRVDIGQDVTLNNGDIFLFDNNGGNDITFEVGYVNANQISYFNNISGISNFDEIILNISQPVDFSQTGNWSIRLSKNDQGFIWTPNWTKSIGELSNQYVNCVTSDSDGNIYIGTQYDEGSKSALVIKLDNSGNKIWSKYFDNNTNSNITNSINCDSQDNIILLCRDNNNYVIITKSDNDGNVIWQRVIEDQNWDASFKSVIDINDNIIISGSYGFDNTYDYVFIKLDSNGNTIWSKSIGRSNYDEYDYWYYDSRILKSKDNMIYKVGYGYTDDYSNGVLISFDTNKIDNTGYYDTWELRDFSTNINSASFSITESIKNVNDIIIEVSPITFISIDTDLILASIQMNVNNNVINTDSIQFSDGTILKSALIKQNLQSYNDYTLQLSDIGGHIYRIDGSGYGITIPTNNSVAFPIGSAITIVSGSSNLYFYIEDSNITEVWGAGYNETSDYWFIPSNSMATLLKIGIDKWMLSGAGLNID